MKIAVCKLMKKLLFILLTVSFLVFGAHGIAANYADDTAVKTEAPEDCKYDQCHATAKSTGNRCKHCVSERGDLYCWQHR